MVGDDETANPSDKNDPLAVVFEPPLIRLTATQPSRVSYTFEAKGVSRAAIDEDRKPGDLDEVFALVRLTSNIPVPLVTAASAVITSQFGAAAAA